MANTKKKTTPKPLPKKPIRAPARKTAAKAPAAPATPNLQAELAVLRALVEERLAPPPRPAAGLEEEADLIRRLLSDIVDRRAEGLIRDLAAVRNRVAAVDHPAARDAVADLDLLLDRLGAERFDAQALDHVDSLIHTVGREVHDPSQPDGVVLESLRPGFRTGRGLVAARALVSVNRRP
jgi:hypothetical protein